MVELITTFPHIEYLKDVKMKLQYKPINVKRDMYPSLPLNASESLENYVEAHLERRVGINYASIRNHPYRQIQEELPLFHDPFSWSRSYFTNDTSFKVFRVDSRLLLKKNNPLKQYLYW